MHVRRTIFTSRPEPPAPALVCPGCDQLLTYRRTVIGGLRPVERWEYYDCVTCGAFLYRHRTKTLRRASSC